MKIYTLGLMLLMAGSTFGQAKKNAKIYKGTPTVDGDLSEYTLDNTINNSIFLPQTADCGITTPGPAVNNTSTFGMGWDETSLYIGVKVVDGALVAGDNVEIFISMLNSNTTNCPGNWPRAYNENEFQFQFFPAIGADQALKMESPQGAELSVTDYKFLTTPEGFNLEVKMSWEELDFFVATKPDFANRVIGFDIVNDDYDAPGTRAAQGIWNQCCGNRHWTESIGFGTATVSEDPLNVTSTTDINNIVSSLVLFPNPTNTESVSLRLNAVSSESVNVSVVNALSENLVSKEVRLNAGQNEIKMSTNGWANGVYYVLVSNGKTNKTQKLVIAK